MHEAIADRAAAIWLAAETLSTVLARAPADCRAWLSASERPRHAALRVAQRAQQYLAGHWLAREGLAALHGGQPEDWRLRERRSQAPLPEPADCCSRLSIAHSGDWVAVAVALQPIGVDIEERRPRPALLGLASLLRTEGDPAVPEADTLLERWVLKEAFVKRHGLSALPELLSRIALRRSAAPAAALRLWSTKDFHLALCAEAGPICGPGAFSTPGAGWRADILPRA